MWHPPFETANKTAKEKQADYNAFNSAGGMALQR